MLRFIKSGKTIANNNSPADQLPNLPAKVRTLGDYFAIREKNAKKHEYSMERWAAERAAAFLGVPRDQVKIDDLVSVRPRLQHYLERARYRRESVRSLCDCVQRIVRHAEKYGWSPANAEVRAAWEEICR